MAEKTVLFVCVQNAGRSIMAEAMFNRDPPAGWRGVSAGTQPASGANPRTLRLLHEIGLDPPSHPPQLLTDEMTKSASLVITMGCLESESCPAGLRLIETRDWALPDPAALDDDGFRGVRQLIWQNIEDLHRELARTEGRRERPASGR